MTTERLLRVFATAILVSQGMTHAGLFASPHIRTCATISFARAGYGVSYEGVIANSDYGFSVTIPSGLIAWGAAPSAPFHGFTIFLDSSGTRESCLDFAIENVFEADESVAEGPQDRNATRVKVGNQNGAKFVDKGVIDGVHLDNVTVHVEIPRPGRKVSVTITLITPREQSRMAERVLESFLRSFRFEPLSH